VLRLPVVPNQRIVVGYAALILGIVESIRQINQDGGVSGRVVTGSSDPPNRSFAQPNRWGFYESSDETCGAKSPRIT